MRLEGCHVLVTGGASGLGAATGAALAEAGAQVSLFDRDAERLAETAAGIGATAVTGDVTDPGAGAAIDTAIDARGPLRALVNCAGIGGAARIVGRDGPMALDAFERVIYVNLVGSFNMMRLAAARISALDPLDTGERGAVVNTASVAAQDGQIGQVAYAASKGGIAAMALPAAREFARFGIRVNTIAPGIFRTPLLGELPEEVQKGIAAAIPFPARLGTPEEFAATVRWVLETPYLNAEMIRLDGGVRLPPR